MAKKRPTISKTKEETQALQETLSIPTKEEKKEEQIHDLLEEKITTVQKDQKEHPQDLETDKVPTQDTQKKQKINVASLIRAKRKGSDKKKMDRRHSAKPLRATANGNFAENGTRLSFLSEGEIKARQEILVAILTKNEETIPKLIENLKKQTNINFKDGIEHSTLLHRCAIQGDSINVAKILIDHGASIDVPDSHNRTPLHICAKKGDVDMLRFFLENGANAMAKNENNQTPLHEASSAGHYHCIEVLTGYRVLLNLHDGLGLTALHHAVKIGHKLCVEYLLQNGADARILTHNDNPQRPIDLIPQIPDPKHPKRSILAPESKEIYRLLKKAGGLKPPSNSNGMMQFGDGIIRRSVDHRLPSKVKKIKPAASTQEVKFELPTGPVKYERTQEMMGIAEQNTKKERPERPPRRRSESATIPKLPQVRLDKRGFIYDEENPPADPVPVDTKQQKKNIQKEQQRAMKWIALMQSDETAESLRKNKKVLRLSDKGIPDEVRGQVWKYLAGVEETDNQIYYDLLEKANWETEIRDQIYRDINRTMPRHILFREKGQGQTMLTNVLLAYSSYRPEVGYCQGMGFITAMFLMYMPEEDAFWLLDQIGGPMYGFGPVWESKMSYLKQCMSSFEKLLDSKYPDVVARFNDNGIPIQAFSSQFFITGFMYNLPFDMAARVWDAFWLRKFDYFYAVGIAIIKLSKDILLRLNMEKLMAFFQFKERESLPFDSDLLVETASTTFTRMKVSSIRKWEQEVADGILAEEQRLEARRKQLETLEINRKERELEKQMEQTGEHDETSSQPLTNDPVKIDFQDEISGMSEEPSENPPQIRKPKKTTLRKRLSLRLEDKEKRKILKNGKK